MSNQKHRSQKLKGVIWIIVLVNLMLTIAKISIGFYSDSHSVIADGIDSMADVLTAFVMLYVATMLQRPPNAKYPYGYERAEVIASKIISFLIFFAGLQLMLITGKKIFYHYEHEVLSAPAIFVTAFSILGKSVLFIFVRQNAKKYSSSMLDATSQNMFSDVFMSFAILAGLLSVQFFKWPVVDLILGFLASIWILITAVKIFLESNEELMEGFSNPKVYHEVIKAVDDVEGADNCHRVRIRKLANNLVIELDIEVDGNINVKRGHEIATEVENRIKENINNVYDIIVHIEPIGARHASEKFGISKHNISDMKSPKRKSLF